jgi:acetoin utilization deacetylase AcuC-like enzyme
MKLVWSNAYEVDLFGHVFPTEKYRLVRSALLDQGLADEAEFAEAPRAAYDDLVLVHTPEYLDDLVNLRLSPRTMRSELALTREIADAYVTAAGGTILTARLALDEGISVHIGGGFHHAYPDHAEGFCYINDIAVALGRLKADGLAERAAVIDCDLHQGNGTAFVFADDPDVFTFSIHQENNYPPKERSDRDVGLPDGADDRLYLNRLNIIGSLLDDHKPRIVVYVAGADPYAEDQLGGLALSKPGLLKRDQLVFSECTRRDIPVCVVLAGGYAYEVSDTVDIHINTIIAAKQALG